MEDEKTSPLHLSPPAQKRTKRSALRCVGFTCLVLVLVIFGLFGFSFYQVMTTTIDGARNPHKAILHKGNAEETSPGKVVKPLIDLDTTYDVAVTVWARKPDNDTLTEERLQRYKEENGDEAESIENTDKAISGMTGLPLKEVQIGGLQTALFAGIVARGLSLKSKAQDIKFTFDLPLERFYDDPLFKKDVWMGVGIIPRSPSAFDRMEAWSEWRPELDHIERLNDSVLWDVQYPFNGNTDMTDHINALEAMATATSLIEFHHVHDPCPSPNSTDADNAEDKIEDDEDDLYSSIKTEDEDEVEGGKTTETGSYTNTGFTEKRLQPFIISRSHFYIMNETRLFDRKAFDEKHKLLRANSCGQTFKGLRPSRLLCSKSYQNNGHWETRFGLHPAAPGGKKELAYGPFVFSLDHSAGPKDVHHIPVHRGNCSGVPRDRSNDPKSMKIEHTLRFSSLTPARVLWLQNVPAPSRLAHNATQDEIIQEHADWEQIMGLMGNKAEGTHPWRRLILSIITEVILGLPISLLTMAYWYTRSTTAGINHFATHLHAIFWILHTGLKTLWGLQHEDEVLGRLFAFVFEGWALIPCWLMLKVVWPLEWIPGTWAVRRTVWSHRERRSLRLEEQISWQTRAVAILASFALTYIPSYFNINLIKPLINSTYKSHATIHWLLKSKFLHALFSSPQLAGVILQLEHNRRSRTFAGQYALVGYMGLTKEVFGLMFFVPWIIGRYDTRGGIQVIDAVWVVVLAYTAWQALTLPRVEQQVEDAEEE